MELKEYSVAVIFISCETCNKSHFWGGENI